MTRRTQIGILLAIIPLLVGAWIYSFYRLTQPEEDKDLLEAEAMVVKYKNRMQQGDKKGAQEALDKALEMGKEFYFNDELPKAEQIFGMIQYDNTAKAYLQKIKFQSRMSNKPRVLFAEYDRLVDKGNRVTAGDRMDDLLSVAKDLYSEREFDEARKIYEGILVRQPEQPTALSQMAVMAKDRGDLDAAIDYNRRAIKADPNSPSHYYNLALIYYERKEYLKAEEMLQHAMALGVKTPYHLLYALCGKARGIPEAELVKRLRTVIKVGRAQANLINPDQLTPDGFLAKNWTKATKMLQERGDDYGIEQLRQMAAESTHPDVREFAKDLLKTLE